MKKAENHCTRVLLLIDTGGLVIGIFPGPCCRYILGLFISTKKCPGPGPRYQYSQCTYNKVCTDKFCTDSESDKGGLVIRTVPIARS